MTYDNFTPRQWRIIKLVSEGLKNKEVGEKMSTSKQVIMNDLRVIFDVTGMNSRLELAMWYVRKEAAGELNNKRTSTRIKHPCPRDKRKSFRKK